MKNKSELCKVCQERPRVLRMKNGREVRDSYCLDCKRARQRRVGAVHGLKFGAKRFA